jgi:hypothetical protein
VRFFVAWVVVSVAVSPLVARWLKGLSQVASTSERVLLVGRPSSGNPSPVVSAGVHSAKRSGVDGVGANPLPVTAADNGEVVSSNTPSVRRGSTV